VHALPTNHNTLNRFASTQSAARSRTTTSQRYQWIRRKRYSFRSKTSFLQIRSIFGCLSWHLAIDAEKGLQTEICANYEMLGRRRFGFWERSLSVRLFRQFETTKWDYVAAEKCFYNDLRESDISWPVIIDTARVVSDSVYAMVWSRSVCPIYQPLQQCTAGLLLWGRRYRSCCTVGAQQQLRTLSRCQLNTDMF